MDSNGTRAHPYFPRDLEIPGYVPNEMETSEILTIFSSFLVVPALILWIAMVKMSRMKKEPFTMKLRCVWFLITGIIHSSLELYFSLHRKTLAGEQTLLAQTWKEYSKGDSRYLLDDTFTVCMETITAFIDGPLAFLTLYAFLARRPYRYVVQLMVSLCQLYGVVLYFMTEYKEDFIHGEMYHPLYFWVYFFLMNLIWVVVPLICAVDSVRVLTKVQAQADYRTSSSKKRA